MSSYIESPRRIARVAQHTRHTCRQRTTARWRFSRCSPRPAACWRRARPCGRRSRAAAARARRGRSARPPGSARRAARGPTAAPAASSRARRRVARAPTEDEGSVALSLCTITHPFYTRFAEIIGASISEATMRPNPTEDAGTIARIVLHRIATRRWVTARRGGERWARVWRGVPEPRCLAAHRPLGEVPGLRLRELRRPAVDAGLDRLGAEYGLAQESRDVSPG